MSLCVSLTHISQTAPFTMRCCSRCADISSMTDKSMTKGTSLLWMNESSTMPFQLFFGSLNPIHHPIRFTNRIQCVSVTIAGLPNTSPMIRFALLRPTPGRRSRASKSSGTLLSYSSRSIFIQALISLALLLPKPQGRTISSISSAVAAA